MAAALVLDTVADLTENDYAKASRRLRASGRAAGKWRTDDPEYPLGKPGRWIGLEGVFGNALGTHGYGIHGTNEPDSIGKQESLGCVRMLNKDVEELWYLMRIADRPANPGDPPPPFSKVTIRD
jgi:hypothetical protein